MPVTIVGIVPARYASTRFPGKPLALIAGKPLIQHVVEQCQKAKSLNEVIVATDDTRIWEVAQNFCRAEMTRPDHPSGSDRIAEVAARCSCDAVVNIQGDEPLIDPKVIDAVAGALKREEMSTAATQDPGRRGTRQSERRESGCQRRRPGGLHKPCRSYQWQAAVPGGRKENRDLGLRENPQQIGQGETTTANRPALESQGMENLLIQGECQIGMSRPLHFPGVERSNGGRMLRAMSSWQWHDCRCDEWG